MCEFICARVCEIHFPQKFSAGLVAVHSYQPGSDVAWHNNLDLDVKAIDGYVDTNDLAAAQSVYEEGGRNHISDEFRCLHDKLADLKPSPLLDPLLLHSYFFISNAAAPRGLFPRRTAYSAPYAKVTLSAALTSSQTASSGDIVYQTDGTTFTAIGYLKADAEETDTTLEVSERTSGIIFHAVRNVPCMGTV